MGTSYSRYSFNNTCVIIIIIIIIIIIKGIYKVQHRLRGHKCIITVTYTDTQDSVVVL